MARRVQDLPSERLAVMPEPCRACVFWETADGPRGPRAGLQEEASSAKEAWWQATQLEWGVPGKVLVIDDQVVGYASFAPAHHFPRTRRMPSTPSDDALLLAALLVVPDQRGHGLAKYLLHSVMREAVQRGAKAVEAYGARRAGAAGLLGTCVIPEEFLLANGFEVRHDHGEHPLLRLDLRKTVRWQESFGHAVEGVVAALRRRERVPAPARPALEATRRTPTGPRRAPG